MVAPEVLPFELGNALTAMFKKRTLNPDEMISAWDMVQKILVELRQIDIRAALMIASHFNIYAYDAYFIECAVSLRCPLLSLDRRMKMVAKDVRIKILE